MNKKCGLTILAVITGLTILYLSGPRGTAQVDLKPVTLPPDLDQYLADSEAQYPDIKAGTEKTIVWANASKTKTPYAIVYLHGYSGSRQETAPMSEEIATQLGGANIYYTRLAGHGRSGAAMADPTANDWLNDTVEALEIGRRLGDRIIVIGVSTGATLATWLAEQPDTDDVMAYILMSPNYAPRDSTSQVMLLPWAEQLVPLLLGQEYQWTPLNEQHAKYWTESYPSRALVQLMTLVDLVRKSDMHSISAPVLVIYSPNDKVISAEAVESAFEQIGSSTKELYPVLESENPEYHVLAGDILAPGDTHAMVEVAVTFLSKLK